MKTKLITTVALSGALALAGCTGSGTTGANDTPKATESSSLPAASAPSSTTSSATTSATTSATSSATTSATSSGPGTSDSGSASAEALGDRMAKAMVAAKSGKGQATATGTASLDMTMEFVFVEPTKMDMHANMKTSGMNLEMVIKGGTFYMKGLPAGVTGGKPWIKADPNGTDPFSKQMSTQLQSMGDPRQITRSFSGGTAKLIGQEGDLTHYTVTGAPGGATVEIYVDKQDRPAKFVVTASGITANVAYSDWGAPVTVTEPPADQVGTMQSPK